MTTQNSSDDQIARLRAAVDAVKALHEPVKVENYLGGRIECGHCTADGDMEVVRYPCPTITALTDELGPEGH